jgi:hypothetical protein
MEYSAKGREGSCHADVSFCSEAWLQLIDSPQPLWQLQEALKLRLLS